jgi:GTPase SAR1 family protein
LILVLSAFEDEPLDQHNDREDENQDRVPGESSGGEVQHHREVHPRPLRGDRERTCPPTQPTVGIDFLAKNISHKAKSYRLQLWDTAGQERFRSLIPSYLKDANCALIVFDVTSRNSLADIEMWANLFN